MTLNNQLFDYTFDKDGKFTSCKVRPSLYPMVPYAIEDALGFNGTQTFGGRLCDLYEGDTRIVTPTGGRGIDHCRRYIAHDDHSDVAELCTYTPMGAARILEYGAQDEARPLRHGPEHGSRDSLAFLAGALPHLSDDVAGGAARPAVELDDHRVHTRCAR